MWPGKHERVFKLYLDNYLKDNLIPAVAMFYYIIDYQSDCTIDFAATTTLFSLFDQYNESTTDFEIFMNSNTPIEETQWKQLTSSSKFL